MCEYCNDTGKVETDNNGPIGPCPVCKQSCSPAGSTDHFEREDRYLVLKRKDIERSLTPTERNILCELTGKIYLDRLEEGRGGLRCVVVESDWPEYESTWSAIQARVEGRT